MKTSADHSIVSDTRNLRGSSTTTTDEERGAMNKIAEFFKGNLGKVFGTNSAVAKQKLDPKLVNSIKSDPKLIKVAEAVKKNPDALNEQKLSRIGQFVESFKKIEYVGDVKGMRIAYGLLVLAIFGIAISGYFITQSVRNSYLH
ncbi:RxLR effector protein [Phytophthora megakarya]|uniref:RxLR effector protein n=1 Tax=Phytophthora megakarya TaxID=4795 RepID=A0A225WJ75_9STRA|nr:RxLR effector protein [Phytophthora megakarya]